MDWAELKELCEDGCPECGKHVFRVRDQSRWLVTGDGNQLQFRPLPRGAPEHYTEVHCHNCGHLIEPETNDAPSTHPTDTILMQSVTSSHYSNKA